MKKFTTTFFSALLTIGTASAQVAETEITCEDSVRFIAEKKETVQNNLQAVIELEEALKTAKHDRNKRVLKVTLGAATVAGSAMIAYSSAAVAIMNSIGGSRSHLPAIGFWSGIVGTIAGIGYTTVQGYKMVTIDIPEEIDVRKNLKIQKKNLLLEKALLETAQTKCEASFQ